MANSNDKALEKEIRALKQKRSYFKGQITSLGHYVETFEDSPKERIKLREKIDRIRILFQRFNDNQDELGSLTEDYNGVEESREELSNVYDDTLAAAIELQE